MLPIEKSVCMTNLHTNLNSYVIFVYNKQFIDGFISVCKYK